MGAECKKLEDAGVDRIQFDVMDGNFVPNLTFGPELIKACRKHTKVPFETQLMISNYAYDTMLDDYVNASKGPNGEPGVVIVHVEACTHLHRSLSRIRAAGGSPSVALNPHTPAEAVENVLDIVDHVLVMTVNPGFGGQAYIPTMLEKIKKLRAWCVDRGYDYDIEVDGGVKVKIKINIPMHSMCLCRLLPIPDSTPAQDTSISWVRIFVAMHFLMIEDTTEKVTFHVYL